MSTAPSETAKRNLRQHHKQTRSRSKSRSRSRSRPQPQPQRPTPKSKKKKTTKETKGDDEDTDGWFAIRDIIDEKKERGKIHYLVDWEGTDTNGQPHRPSWQPKKNVTAVAIDAWKKKATKKPTQDNSAPSSTQDSPQLSTEESDSIRPPNWHRQTRNRKRPLETSIADESESDIEPTPKRQRRRTGSFPESSNSVGSGPRLGRYLPKKVVGVGVGVGNSKYQDVGSIGASRPNIKGGQRHPIVVELPHNPSVNPSEFDRLASSQETATGSKHPSGSSCPPTVQAHTAKTKRDEHQVIPDSQGTSQGLFSSSLSAHQPGTGLHASRPITSAGQDQASLNSLRSTLETTSFQAAQIVSPLGSQHDQLATQSHDNFTVYNDSVLANTASKSRIQPTSQHSSQALNELDGNTRSALSFSYIGPESRASNSVELSQGQSDKHADNSEVEEAPAGQSRFPTSAHPDDVIYPPQRPTTSTNMDNAQSTPMTAREKLKLLRDSQFALLDASPSPLNSTGTNQSVGQLNPSTASRPDGQGPQTIEVPPPDISPLTPTPLVSPTFLTQPLTTTQDISSNERHSLIPEAAQGPVEQEHHDQSSLEDSGPTTSYDASHEEQPATLDPSTLTLSIENDMDITPSIPTDDPLAPSLPLQNAFVPHEEDDTHQYYPTSLLPYVPAGPSEYLVTLPFHNSIRPVYNDILRESEDLIREYNDSFRVLPYQKPHPTTVAKLDEMFSRLLDVCDLPPFMDTIPSMNPAQVTKHVLNTNAKFAFIAELLHHLAEADSDKKILILARPGKVLNLLGHVVETKGYRYIRSGLEIVGSSSAEHSLTVAISSTLDSPSSIPEDTDVIIAFDHTYRQELLPASVRERSLLIVLTNMCSIQHINMRIADNIERLERKNVLALSLVKAMRYVEEANDALISRLPQTAETFAKRIQMQDDDDFYWRPLEVPENVFEDLHASSQLLSQPSLQGYGSDQLPGSRKRSHEDEDDETSSKRLRMSQPTVVTNINHISDALRSLIGDDFIGDSSRATLSVSISKLETLAARVATLEAKLEESKQQEKQFRDLSDRTKKELDDYTSALKLLQRQYMVALKDRGTYEYDCRDAKEEAKKLSAALASSKEENHTLEKKIADLEIKAAETKELLRNSSNPEVVKVALLEKDIEDLNKKAQQLENKVASTESDMDYTRTAYQDASQRAAELGAENRTLEQRIEELSRKADENIVEVNRIQARSEVRELVRMIEEQKSVVRDREAELARTKDELKTLKESRRGTRQSSVPRSPRLSAFTNAAANSPRNGAARASTTAKGGSSSSRGTSPAPPTGVFEAGGSATPAPNNRHSHLRETRF
ncbi:NADP-dependent glutamate dehydrogenase [Hypoxylon texense]